LSDTVYLVIIWYHTSLMAKRPSDTSTSQESKRVKPANFCLRYREGPLHGPKFQLDVTSDGSFAVQNTFSDGAGCDARRCPQRVIAKVRQMVEDSSILECDTKDWPPPLHHQQELSVQLGETSFECTTCKLGSASFTTEQIRFSKDSGVQIFHHLGKALREFGTEVNTGCHEEYDWDDWEFHAGDKVQIQGIQNAAHQILNGQSAILESFIDSSQRWCVQLEDGEKKDLKPQNIALQDETINISTSGSRASTDSLTREELIRNSLEFYFSAEHLMIRDSPEYYLRKQHLMSDRFPPRGVHADAEGWIDISEFLNTSRMKRMKTTREDVLAVLTDSHFEVKVLEGEKVSLRRSQNKKLPVPH